MGEGRHQWVEVYFPCYGWVMFDPTGGSVSRQAAFQPGVDGATPPPQAPAP
jgi:transglutaminase-like putative cysteine protease